jgi:hypothetical protein
VEACTTTTSEFKASGKISRTMAKQPGLVFSLSVSHDGKHAAVVYRSAERFLDINHLRLLDLENGIILADYQKPGITIHGGTFNGARYLFASRPAANSLFGLFTSSLCVRSGKTVSWPETWS